MQGVALPQSTLGIGQRAYDPVWHDGAVRAVSLEVGGSLAYENEQGEQGLLEGKHGCTGGACVGLAAVQLRHDVLLALRQMRESGQSSPSVFFALTATDTEPMLFQRPSPKLWPQDAVTLVTQFTLSRLERFERTLREWDGPISVAIYLTDAADVDRLETYLSDEQKRLAFRDLALTLVKPDYAINEAALVERLRYPINKLRNLALALAPTLYVVVTDADFVPSPKMHQLLRSRGVPLITHPTSHTPSPTLRRTAIVVSAFVLSTAHVGAYPATATELATLLDARPPLATLTDVNAGHGPSLPSLLFQTSSPRLVSPAMWPPRRWAYEVCYEPQWEPYYLLHRPSHPLYDERFTDQGGDKQSHTLLINALGYEFKILRDVWFMHPAKGGANDSLELEEWPSARLVESDHEERGKEEVLVDPAHFSKAQIDVERFRYFQDFLPEMERDWGSNVRWPRGCNARTVWRGSFGRAGSVTIFGF